ncbi:MAG: (E)-4-hydroxy-3-methylbut-2-enyl-diphosphate synthase [Terrimicrobiaceae bacterium]
MEPVYRPYSGRRPAREVRIGRTAVGGNHPIRVQSMLTSDTMNTEACVKETLGLVEVGCEIVRITAPTVKDAENLENIRAALRQKGCAVPLVADIHFKPDAALEAAKWVDKIRINPGNFADSKKFNVREYTDAQYEAEIGRIRERFQPLVALCKERGVAMRIGTNHGSLSDRIMNRYGDTPLGMVESALEFAHVARELDYHELVFSMKASNPKVMIEAYRLLVARLQECEMRNAECGMKGPLDTDDSAISNSPFRISHFSWNYPIHLGVTEAGDSDDGRIKSAIGIGSLLADGIGDTIRVSLTEDSVHEIPVAMALVALAESRGHWPPACESKTIAGGKPSLREKNAPQPPLPFDPFSFEKRRSDQISAANIPAGGDQPVRVAVRRETHDKLAHKLSALGDFQPEIVYENAGILEVDPREDAAVASANACPESRLVTIPDGCDLDVIPAFRMLAARVDPRHPVLLKDSFQFPNAKCEMRNAGRQNEFLENLLSAATNIGSLLCDGIGDAVLVQGEEAPGQSLRIAYNILQAAGVRIFKTDYVACPSCGRTLFNLQETTGRIKEATIHLKGVKIAVMGCIVNGPGEMADADFGYVGGAPGKVNLYVGKTPVKFNIPESEAVGRLVDLIREHGRWFDPPVGRPA